MKRLRAKLARSKELAAEAHELTRVGHADYSLKELTARAADDAASAVRQLEMWDQRMRINAEAIARDLEQRKDETRP